MLNQIPLSLSQGLVVVHSNLNKAGFCLLVARFENICVSHSVVNKRIRKTYLFFHKKFCIVDKQKMVQLFFRQTT